MTIVRARDPLPRRALALMQEIGQRLPARSADARLGVRTRLDMLLVLLHERLLTLPGHTRRPVDRRPVLADVKAALELAANEHARPIAVADAARAVAMSVSRFSRAFRRATGKSFVAYLNGVRVARAQELLEESEIPVAQIAYEVGFSNQSYFGLMFRRDVGMTPGRYRQLARGEGTARREALGGRPG